MKKFSYHTFGIYNGLLQMGFIVMVELKMVPIFSNFRYDTSFSHAFRTRYVVTPVSEEKRKCEKKVVWVKQPMPTSGGHVSVWNLRLPGHKANLLSPTFSSLCFLIAVQRL